MKISQNIAELFCPLYYIFLLLGALLLQNAVEGLSLDIVHNNEKGSVPVNHVNDAGQIGMVQLFQKIRLSDQPLLYHLKILNAVLPHLFDSPLFIGPFHSSRDRQRSYRPARFYSVFYIFRL